MKTNDERGTMNDELNQAKACSLFIAPGLFIVHRSAFIVRS
jgi:hypothetical protein